MLGSGGLSLAVVGHVGQWWAVVGHAQWAVRGGISYFFAIIVFLHETYLYIGGIIYPEGFYPNQGLSLLTDMVFRGSGSKKAQNQENWHFQTEIDKNST